MEKLERSKKWNVAQLRKAVETSTSLRQVLGKIGLKQAGGNYEQIKKYLDIYKIKSGHFKGKGWNKGMTGVSKPRISMKDILIKGSHYQSFKLKNRLYNTNIKERKCEECGWAKISIDGRLPLELDHINGDRHDNRLSNLRILCPNCHSLKVTHRGRNIGNNA